MTNMNNFALTIPDDCIFQILANLKTPKIVSLSRLSKRFNDIIVPQALFKRLKGRNAQDLANEIFSIKKTFDILYDYYEKQNFNTMYVSISEEGENRYYYGGGFQTSVKDCLSLEKLSVFFMWNQFIQSLSASDDTKTNLKTFIAMINTHILSLKEISSKEYNKFNAEDPKRLKQILSEKKHIANYTQAREEILESIEQKAITCDLGAKEVKQLPAEFATLNYPELQKLIISLNKLPEIPKAVFTFTNLKILDVSNNKLTELPEDIKKLTCLEELTIHDNPLHIHNHLDEMGSLYGIVINPGMISKEYKETLKAKGIIVHEIEKVRKAKLH